MARRRLLYVLFGGLFLAIALGFVLSAYFLTTGNVSAIWVTIVAAVVVYLILASFTDILDHQRDAKFRVRNLNFPYYHQHSTRAAVEALKKDKQERETNAS
jgi:hypothetical protein